ncbi:ABC transporter ATP-binding protein [Bartonella apihabitans]|uniref:ABC transporter ATP-binding protein n=1 Tax=uncultured Bartonella sp. TaxID=104108 RepID=UPI0025CFFF47|nr:ABC transporter ATP-binding protein [Bartonella apihabitans]WLT08264.1 ABC transporter ATP-binding protein [Bartonella apihabitans]
MNNEHNVELVVENLEKWLGGLQILKGVNFTAERGSIVALLGGSGSGKTTLLRSIAGLENPEVGRIRIGDKIARDSETNIQLPPEQRDIGLVFQSYALWPHRTVRENVAYGLKLRHVDAAEIKKRVDRILETMGLSHLADRYPSELSGGQQQRVSICRAVVYEPRVLLLDEPLSNLDAKLREEARYWIRKLILELDICAILVTHDQTEALAAADHILLLQNGRIVQHGSPIEIYSNPNCFYAAEFLGANNIAHGQILQKNGAFITFGAENWSLTGMLREGEDAKIGEPVKAVIRLEHIKVSQQPVPEAIPMHLDASLYLGDRWEYRLHYGSLELKASGPEKLETGEVYIVIKPEDVWLFRD